MSTFKRKTISRGQILGEKLQYIRQQKGLSLADLHEQTDIPVKYLEALESGDYQSLPGDVYAKAWIKKYAAFLEIEDKELLVDYKLEKQISEKASRADKVFSNRSQNRPWQILLKPRTIKIAAIVFLALAFFSYLGWEVKNIISPPEINITQPQNLETTQGSSIEIVGQTEPEVQLIINGEQVLLDNSGHFRQVVNLAVGLNKLKISAKKKHSKTSNMELSILRENIE